jgi:hypothetical protein
MLSVPCALIHPNDLLDVTLGSDNGRYRAHGLRTMHIVLRFVLCSQLLGSTLHMKEN